MYKVKQPTIRVDLQKEKHNVGTYLPNKIFRIFARLNPNTKKGKAMATITLQYDARNTIFKQLIQLFISLGGKVKIEDEEKNGTIREAIKDYESGNSVKCKDFDDYLVKINS